jgi:hypothetical protein
MMGRSEPEVGLFVVWAHGRTHEDRIAEVIRDRFEVPALYEVHWSAPMISRNFSRFYRGRPWPPYRTSVEHQKGRGPFLAAIVIDRSPRYEQRETTGGWRRVNTRIFDTKSVIRDWIDDDYSVHSSDTSHTAARELTLLFGRDPQTWLSEQPSRFSDQPTVWREDPIATTGWQSIRHLYDALGWCTMYVDLDGGHGTGDVDAGDAPIRLLTNEYKEVLSILAAKPASTFLPTWGGSYSVSIGGHDAAIDLRSGGDGYLGQTWAEGILERRVLRSNGAFAPRDDDLFESCLYHLLVHQSDLRSGDLERLNRLATQRGEPPPEPIANRESAERLLKDVMADRSYKFTKPRDTKVFYNHRLAESSRPALQSGIDAVSRRWEQVIGTAMLAPIRTLVLGAREWLLVRLPALRSLEGRIRRHSPWALLRKGRKSRRR